MSEENGARRNGQSKSEGVHSDVYVALVVLLLSVAMAFSLVDRFALSLLFEPIKADLGLSDTRLGLLHGVAFGIFYAAVGLPLGQLVDVWSRKWTIFWGLAIWSLATMACGFANDFSMLLLMRIGVGVGEAALAPAGYSIITAIAPRRLLATAISVFQMGSLAGAGMAFLLGGALFAWLSGAGANAIPFLDGHSAWQKTFVLLGAPGIVLLALILLIREPARPAKAPAEAEAPRETILQHIAANGALYSTLFIGNACLVAVSYAMVSWAPAMLARDFGWSVSVVGLRVGLMMLTVAPAGVLLGGMLADFLSRASGKNEFGTALSLAAFASLPLLACLLFARNGAQLFAIIAAVQFASSMAVGVGPAAIQVLAPPSMRGRMSALYVFTVNAIGLGVGPVTIGLLSDHVFKGDHALLSSLVTYTISMCAAAALLLFAFRKLSRR
ncbi:MAG TPA: MFS transporter [Parvularculaceae bacterium]|nr:MFS transporter [Amphiplicatus sp.]MCB9956931.1 MFS transporter [Caulobacterales bacterium]HPE32301.1 MFS transporter [Parvularculaceae bacterium]HRX38023.1 MFS transporter [Parvularculaceae bacterium]